MVFDNQLFSFLRDGQHGEMAITILGSGRSLQLRNGNPLPYVTIHETSQQTEQCGTKINREATTRDRERERARRRYSRDLDVRYLSSWKSLKEKLLSAYSCNQNQCPMIRERLLQHNQSIHGRRCEKKCSLAASKSKNCVSIRAGPDFDQYSDQKCGDCPIIRTSSNCSDTRASKYHESCAKPTKGNLKNDKKYSEGCTSPFNNTLKIKSEYGTGKNRFDGYVDTSCNEHLMRDNRYGRDSCCDLKVPECNENNVTNIRSGRYVDGCTAPNVLIIDNSNDNATGCCDISDKPVDAHNCTEYASGCTTASPDFNDTNACVRGTEYVEGCNTTSFKNLTNNKSYANTFCDALKKPDCTDNYTTYSSSYIGNIEAPRFPIIRSSNNHDEECEPSTSKNTPFTCTTDTPTNTPMMVDNGNCMQTCTTVKDKLTPCKKLYTVDESTGGDSIMSSLMSIVQSRSNGKNKTTKAVKHLPKRNKLDSSTSNSYKLIPPYAVDKSSNGTFDSKLSLKNNRVGNRRNSNSNPIYREVKEWIREIPMYPGLEKEAKDKNTAIINDLVKSLYKLSGKAGNSDYNEKIRNEIDACLDKIPLWYPGAKGEQSGFKSSLVDRLTQRLKKLNRKNTGTNYSKRKSSRNPITEVHTSLTSCNYSFSNQFSNDSRNVEVKICIIDWLRFIYSKSNNNHLLKNQLFLLADFVTFRINPLLNKPINASNDNLILKTAILNIMNDLPIVIACPINKQQHIHDLAENLANQLLCIQVKYGCKHSSFPKCSNEYSYYMQKETAICRKIRKCFEDAQVDYNNEVIEEAGVILNNCFEMSDPKGKRRTRNEMMNLLVTSTNLSEAQAWNLAKSIIKNVRNIFVQDEVSASAQTCSQLRRRFTTSVYTSIDTTNPLTIPVSSTPKKKRINKVIPKLNPQEIQYMENVGNLIRTWMNTLPENFSAPDEHEFKETMINDLAGDIMDQAKLEQLAPDSNKDKSEIRKYIVCRWIFKLGAFEFRDVYAEIDTFLNKLQEIPAPIMTQPQHGNRQAMENIKFNKASNFVDNFVPKGIDVLEDEISIWMHEQPSNIFTNNDQQFKQDKIHELAQVLENNSGKKRSQKEVSKEIRKWLNQIVIPENKREISELTENLKDRVINLPHDETLAGIVENRTKRREEHKKAKLEETNAPKIYTNNNKDNEPADPEDTMAIFISKFIEHHYDIDDPLARRAFNRLLNGHLLSLNASTRKEVYDKFEKNENDDRFPPSKVIRELEYIKDISDWLKNLPIEASYNTVGNRERIDFVNSLALSIREVEEDRENNPDAMDYDMYMSVIILEHLKLLPIPQEYNENVPFMIDQIFNKIIAHRQAVSDAIKTNESINTTGINPDNIGDFIEEFIRNNGDDIAHDEVKMEAWAIRLIREIKKILTNTSCPSTCKAEIYKKLSDVPIPSDETAEFFNLELDYVKEITNWMKNLPLLPMDDSEKDNVTKRICDLAEKMVESERKQLANPNDKGVNTELKEYVANWISELQLDNKQEIVLPIIIQQLMNRMKKTEQNDESLELKTSENTANKNDKAKKSKSSIFSIFSKNKEPTSINLTDAIEKWSRALPIKAENDNDTINMKNDISRKIFQEVGQLNMNPTINNDDILYKDNLGDGIYSILETVPQNNELQNKKDKLKDDIVNTILEIKKEIKEKTAGDTYKIQLEKTIDTSIPDPLPCYQVYDPGFEIYKDRLATAFILENFDHGADAVKIRYEILLRKEINKYFSHAKNRNATPLSNDQLYNELYSALFKVPIPNEMSVIGEVEKVKTRCEIDAWFEELPMRKANSLNELLDWDKILSSLATRIHEIETSESKQDNKIFKEIMKWLTKLPLKPGNENKLEEYATTLQNKLKSTADQRKCVIENSKTKSKKDKGKAKIKEAIKRDKENSQIAGPSSSGKMWATERRSSRKNPAEEVYDIVHTWCNELPLNANDHENAQLLKDDLTTKVIIKISELNANSIIFNDDVLYDELLDEELERLLSIISNCDSFCNSKAARIYQLKENIKSVKPHIAEEMASHKYKQNLTKTVDKILERPKNLSPEKEHYLDAVRTNIVDDFVLYKHSNDDNEGKQGHKIDLQDNIIKYITINSKCTNCNIKKDVKNNPLLKTNLVISEMAKVLPKSSNIVRNEVEEIRMKKEIGAFFDEIGLQSKEVAKTNCLIENLAKKLNDIEINGYSLENEDKMKQEIVKCLKKLGKDKNQSVIDAFVIKLKSNENARRMPQVIAEKNAFELNDNDCNRECPSRMANSKNGYTQQSTLSTGNNIPEFFSKSAACSSKKDPKIYENKTDSNDNGISCQQKFGGNYNAETEQLPNENQEAWGVERTSDEADMSSDDEDKSICLCKKKYGNRRKRRPYCMVPIPMRYVCEGRDVLNSLWCDMPLP